MSDEPVRRPARQLTDASFLVVGGTSGVGLATALAAVEAGVPRVVLAGRDPARGIAARDVVRERALTAQVELVTGDANTADGAASIVAQATEAVGPITVLVVSTAAADGPALLKDIPLAEIADRLAQQALAPLLMSTAVLPGMTEQGEGVILNVASDAAKVPTPGESVIGAAMAAIVMFTQTLAMEAKRDGIRVNALTPSLIQGTPTYDKLMEDPFASRLFGKAAKLASLGVAEPEDLAGLVLYLASPAAAKLTGQAISLNGGISAA